MHIKKSSHSHYIKWRIQRPERFNALGTNIGSELLKSIQDLEKTLQDSKEIRMLAICAESVKSRRGLFWIAGGDLKELSKLKDKRQAFDYGQCYQDIIKGLRKLPIPVVFGIHGQAIGGGVELCLGGDLRIATEASSFHFKQTAVGLATGYGGSTFLKELVGLSKASSWLFQNKTLEAAEALSEGLIHDLCKDETKLDEKLDALAEHFSQQSPEGLAAQKAMLNQISPEMEHNLRKELEEFTKIWRNPHHEIFLKPFVGKD